MKLQVIIKNVYGNELIYPACEKAKLLAALANSKTITLQALTTIKKLAYTVEVVSAFQKEL
jgi:hypothetical protein